MTHKILSIIFLLMVSFGPIGCFNLNYFTGGGSTQSQNNNNIYSEGKTYVKLEEMRNVKGSSNIFLTHPKYLRKDILSSILSSINFKEKGVTGWGKEQNVFLETEILSLAPHITDAFSRAAPSQYVLVNSAYAKGKGLFKSDLYTIFGLFISDDKLNIIFSRVQYESVMEKGESVIFTNTESVFVDPFSIKKNPFWKLIPGNNQQFKEGYENWLVIELEKDIFVDKEQENESASNGQSIADNIQDNQIYATSETASNYPKIVESKENLKDQLLELKELVDTGLITNEDYERRKAEILSDKKGKSLKKKFVELRSLYEKGFISNIDYEHKKRDLLDENDEAERERNIKDVLAEYLELRDEGFITDKDYDYKKKKLLREF